MRLFIVTGSSRGIGAAISRQLLTTDTAVHTVARHRNAELDEAVGSCGAHLAQYEVDLRRTEEIPGLVGRMVGSAAGGIHEAVLINNAGLLDPIGPVTDIAPGALASHVAVNLTALMQLTASFLAVTADRVKTRTVVNISSGAATTAYEGWAPYCSTKAAVEMFTRVTALEQRDHPGTRIISVAPGVVDTEMQALIRSTSEEKFPHRDKFVGLKESGRLADPADSAALVLRAAADPAVESGACVDVRKLYLQ